MDCGGKLHEEQAGFGVGRSCMDNAYALNDVVQGRLKEGNVILFAYDTVWRDGLWLKLWEMGIKGKVWSVIKQMYEFSRSAVVLEGRSQIHLVWNRAWHRGIACPVYCFLFLLVIS